MRGLTKNWLMERKGINLDVPPQRETEHEMEELKAVQQESEYPATHSFGVSERAEAYVLLEQAAEILAKCEPHSPVPYLIRRLVTWKNKSLSELMEELSRREIDLTVLQKLFQDLE